MGICAPERAGDVGGALSFMGEIETIAAGRGIRDLPTAPALVWQGLLEENERQHQNPTTEWPDSISRSSVGMKRTASAKKSSSASATSIRRKAVAAEPRFAVCVRNDGYGTSLERNKIYPVLPDDDAERDGDLRVVDESGEDYLFSADRFVAIEVPSAVRASLLKASRA
jgi:hypothetical protein